MEFHLSLVSSGHPFISYLRLCLILSYIIWCLVIFYWLSYTVNFMLLDTRYFCVTINIFRLIWNLPSLPRSSFALSNFTIFRFVRCSESPCILLFLFSIRILLDSLPWTLSIKLDCQEPGSPVSVGLQALLTLDLWVPVTSSLSFLYQQAWKSPQLQSVG